jgi:hypothetical protein
MPENLPQFDEFNFPLDNPDLDELAPAEALP